MLHKVLQNGFFLHFKCTKLDFGWGSTPKPCSGSLKDSPDLLAVSMAGCAERSKKQVKEGRRKGNNSRNEGPEGTSLKGIGG